ncbi:MAG: ABC transporter permease [Firmicutes bacterium]|nr:ABC transporter permease [Dethiobacter sp.]MBS3889088.1 ABC transporter permease [Bacillota bacterium]MBS4053379.1 ABC transporter permease [Thermaerobacter sp.]
MIKLAYSSMRHRLTRTIITIFAMAIAAAVVTSGMALSQGIARRAYIEYRTYYQGDILVFTPTYVGAAMLHQVNSRIKQAILYDSGFNSLLRLYPHFGATGYLAYEAYPYVPISLEQIGRLRTFSGIQSAEPTLLMPGRVGQIDITLKVTNNDLENHLVTGRVPHANAHNYGSLEIVVNAHGGIPANLGNIVTVTVPAFGVGASGIPFVDFSSAPQEYAAKVVGIAEWPTRELSYFPPGVGGEPIYEQGYVHSAEIYLAPSAWEQIWHRQAENLAYPVLSASLRVDNLSRLNVIAAQLRSAFPELTIKTVPEVARHVERYNLLDHFYTLPSHVWQVSSDAVTHEHVPVEFGLAVSLLLFANAGMLLAGQMLSGVAERKKEIGILKTLGARRSDIVGMVLIEGFLLASIGSLLGFSFIRLLATIREFGNQAGALSVIYSTAKEFLTVMSLTTLVSLIFSAIPAACMANLTVMEVLRNE